jgi:predicted nucleotidyltransferase component of viral defense system
MVPVAIVRQYAAGQKIGVDVADQEIVLHYVLRLLYESGLTGRSEGGEPGPLLFKGGTALRKCVFGQTGRFSQDLDMDAAHKNGFEAGIEDAFRRHSPFHGIEFSIPTFRYSQEGNFSGHVSYTHAHGEGAFELQISYRLEPILEPMDLSLVEQPYFRHVEFACPPLFGLDPYEMIGEKLMACNRRRGGSAKDPYDLYLWSGRAFNHELVRRIAVLKAWTDQRRAPRYDPEKFLATLVPRNFRWEDISGLVPRNLQSDAAAICSTAQGRFRFLADCSDDERRLLDDQFAHRELELFSQLRDEARRWSEHERAK